jgi:hypothetical protein
MAAAINQVGHVMGSKTIAEFVENDSILSTDRRSASITRGDIRGALQPL